MFTLNIETRGAAFADASSDGPSPCPELARIMRELAERIDGGELAGTVRDLNGNTCGSFDLRDTLNEPNPFSSR